jgi:hypothetical protein
MRSDALPLFRAFRASLCPELEEDDARPATMLKRSSDKLPGYKIQLDGLKKHGDVFYIRQESKFYIRLIDWQTFLPVAPDETKFSVSIVGATRDDPPTFRKEGVTGAIFTHEHPNGTNSFTGTLDEIAKLRTTRRKGRGCCRKRIE